MAPSVERSFGFGYWSRRVDWPLLVAVGVLLSLGLLAVFSAVSTMGNPTRFIVKQMIAVAIGGSLLFLLSSINYQLFRNHPWVLYAATVFILALVLVIGRRINGAK